MNTDASVGKLFETLKKKLELDWFGSHIGENRSFSSPDSNTNKPALVGHLNVIHPNRVQILGSIELQYLEKLDPQTRTELLTQLFDGTTELVVVGDAEAVPDYIRQRAEASSTPMLVSTENTPKLVSYLQYYLTSLFAEQATVHGVFMEIFSLGMLITGEPSSGKSELALELVARGHRLVADDACIFSRTAPDTINGRCPDVLRDFLEVRGLGILNIRAMYGDSAIKASRNLRLILKLEKMTEQQMQNIDRLHGARSVRSILGVDVPEITLPVAPGRNLAVLAEAASRNHNLYLKGFNASKLFIERQSRILADN